MDRLTWYFGSSLCAYSYYATNAVTALSRTRGGVGGERGSFHLRLGVVSYLIRILMYLDAYHECILKDTRIVMYILMYLKCILNAPLFGVRFL